jgi:hypothetical protein
MKYQHQSKEYKQYTKGLQTYFNTLGKKNKFTARKKNEDVRKSVVVDYFKNKVREFFISKYYAEKNWINRHVLKQIIMLPVTIDFQFSKVKCALGFHFYSKQQLVNAGIRPPKQRAKYYKQCFLCGKGVK